VEIKASFQLGYTPFIDWVRYVVLAHPFDLKSAKYFDKVLFRNGPSQIII
jgi:hypothetical protein